MQLLSEERVMRRQARAGTGEGRGNRKVAGQEGRTMRRREALLALQFLKRNLSSMGGFGGMPGESTDRPCNLGMSLSTSKAN